ncbi:MAG: ABC transporter permease [Nocardioidaceae bacterium]
MVVAVAALVPLGHLVVRGFEDGVAEVVDIIVRERTLRLLIRSLVLAGTVTALCVVIGVGLAVLVTRTDLPGRRFWGVVAALPLAVPSYVAAFAWLAMTREAASFLGLVTVLTACTYPYVYLPVVAALARTDPALEDVARSLGRGRVHTLCSVTLRQVRPAIASGALLVSLYVLSDFGAPSILRYDVFTRVIHQSYRASFDRTPAKVLSIVLVVVTLLITLGEQRSRGRAEHARLGSGVARRPTRFALGRWRPFAPLLPAAVAVVALGIPGASLGYWMWRGQTAGIELDRLTSATVATIGVGAVAAVVTTLCAIPLGILAARYRTRGVHWLENSAYAVHALPGIVVALALVFLGVRFAQPFYQELPLLVAAYVVLFLPLAVGAVRSAVTQSSRRAEDVARSLGYGTWSVLRKVTLPVSGPGVAAGAAMVWLTCMKELPATLLLRPTGMDTLATRLWSETGVRAFGAAAPYAIMLVVMAMIPTWWLGVRGGRDRREELFHE